MPLTLFEPAVAVSSAANVTTLSATFTTAPASGRLLLCAANSDATLTMSSTGWSLADSSIGGTGLYLWYKIAGSSESSTVTIAPSVAASAELVVMQFTGNATSGVLDQTAHASGGATTGTTAATAQNDELAVAAVGMTAVGGTISATWTNGFTANPATTVAAVGTNGTGIHVALRSLTSTGTVTSTATPSEGSAVGGLVATFKASSSGVTYTKTGIALVGP